MRCSDLNSANLDRLRLKRYIDSCRLIDRNLNISYHNLREMPNVESTPVVAMSTAAVLERYGEKLQVAGTLLKPITQATLVQALERYR